MFVVEGGDKDVNAAILKALKAMKIVHDDPKSEVMEEQNAEPPFWPQ